MKDFILVFLSIFAVTSLGENDTSVQPVPEHLAATSIANGAIGDHVAAGLGISTRESTSGLSAKTSDHLPETVNSSFRFLTFSKANATLTSAGASAAGNVTATLATDCWNIWLNYWSASKANILTSDVTFDVVSTRTTIWTDFSRTERITSSWISLTWTYTYIQRSTLYSGNYPVSVSTFYTTYTDSLP